jgi:hypothetical protein
MERASERAFRTAMAAAESAGLPVGDPAVLHEGSSLLVHLRPAPVVVRVALRTAVVRHGDAWYAREVAVATYLADAGAPVVAPSAQVDPGPHARVGLTLSFWEHVEPVDEPVDAEAAGRGLRECHEILTGFGGELPRQALLHEAEAIARQRGTPEGRRIADAVGAARERIEALGLAVQPVHGDAGLRNVIQTARGPLWNDWEDAQLAPTAWDLGCLHAGARVWDEDPAPIEAAQRGYGPPLPDEVIDAFVQARSAQADAWTALYPE